MCKQNFKTQHTDQTTPKTTNVDTRAHEIVDQRFVFNKFSETWHHPKITPTMPEGRWEQGKECKSSWQSDFK